MDDERVEYSFVWLIENFSYCWHKEKLTSPVFYAFELEDTSWRMVLYPRGERDKDYISFYLFRNTEVNGPENVSLNYKLSGPAELGSSIRSEEGNYTFTKGHGREWPRFVKIEEIPYLSRDIMVVKCRVRKGGGKVQKVTTIRARTRIAVEKVSFVHEVENFSTLKPSEKKAIEKQSGSKEGFSVSSSLYFDFDSSCEGEMTIEITPSDGTYILCKRKISLFDASGNVIECSENDNRFDVEEKNIQKLPLPLARQDILNKKSVYLPGDRLSLLCECAFSTGLEYDHIELIRHKIPGAGTKEVSDWLQPHFESMGKRLKLEFTNEDKPDRGVGNITLEMGVENFSTTSEIASVFHGEEDKPILYRVRVFAGNIGGWLAVSPEVKIFHEEAWDIYFIPNYLWWTVSIIDTKGHSRFPQYFEKYPDKDEDETDELREAKYLEKSFILDRADELLSEDVLSLRCDIHFDLDVIQEIWASSEQKFNDVDFFSFVRKILWKLYFTPDDHAEFRYKDLKIVRVLKVHDLTFQNLTLPESYPFGVHDISPDPKSISSESGEDIADILKDVWMFDTNPDRFLLSITRRPGNLGRFLIASSPVIRRCIDTPMREQGEKRIQLSNVDGLIFTMVLYFLKCGRIPRCKFDELVEIYEFSHFYLMENLQFRSAKCMAEKCDSISLLEEIKSMADLNSDEYLLKLLDRRRRELEELSRGLELKKHGNPDAVEDRPDFDCFI